MRLVGLIYAMEVLQSWDLESDFVHCTAPIGSPGHWLFALFNYYSAGLNNISPGTSLDCFQCASKRSRTTSIKVTQCRQLSVVIIYNLADKHLFKHFFPVILQLGGSTVGPRM